MAEQGFCFLKGLVDCHPGTIQDCNIKRVRKCPLDEQREAEIASKINNKPNPENLPEPAFCFLRGLVECPPGTIQDCNAKHVSKCKLEEDKK